MGGFTTSSSPSLQSLKDESDDDGSGGDDVDEDDGASSFGDEEMTAGVTCPLSFVTKRGSSFGYESSHVLGGELV